jgi:50S ribosomal protein L16 3-hydroxylase
MIAFATRLLRRIRWSTRDVERFVGEYLSEPKAHVVFRPGGARPALSRARVRLDAKTRLLYRGSRFFINGETLNIPGTGGAEMRALADRRAAPGARLARVKLGGLISEWQRAGYVHLE